MKRLTVIVCCILLLIPTALIKPAYAASSRYARANNEKAYFYSENREKSLFAVPYTYCIEILDEDGDWYFARYGEDTGVFRAVKGYCKKQDFTPEPAEPPKTYLDKTVTVTFKADKNDSYLPMLDDITYSAAYYGYYQVGDEFYSYVCCQGSFGYIKGKNDDYEPNAPAFAETPEGGESAASSNFGFASIAFIVIASLAVVVVLIIYFTTKKPKIDG